MARNLSPTVVFFAKAESSFSEVVQLAVETSVHWRLLFSAAVCNFEQRAYFGNDTDA